jgi:hypothetical protein
VRSKFQTIGRGGRVVLALVVAAAAFGLVSAVQAAIPSANGSISGCYARSGPTQGALRVVDEGNPCKPGESPLTWSQTGPTGPKGDPGPQGPVSSIERQGAIAPDGTKIYSSGFTVTHTPGSGVYVIDFPCGTFNYDLDNFPIITMTTFSGLPWIWGIGQEVLWGCGAFEATVGTYNNGDHQFVFHVLQHVGPNVPGKAPSQNAKTVINP